MLTAYIAVILAALFVAALTLFSGFGLGTLLMPVFALFFPLEAAIAATGVVHLSNNLLKVALLGKWANRRVVVRFALPAACAAFVGAGLLSILVGGDPWYEYELGGRLCTITPVKIVVAVLILFFSMIEAVPKLKALSFTERYLPLGGILSGFFGGLSGHQGALRSAFLVRLGLSKQEFLGTVVVAAVIVDCTRLLVYGVTLRSDLFSDLQGEGLAGLVIAGSLAAFVGTFIGKRLVEKVTLKLINRLVAIMLVCLAFALGLGIV